MTLELEEGFRRRVAGSKAVITLCQSARVFHDSKRTGLKDVPHLRSRTVGKGMSKGGVVVGFVGLGTMGSRMAANVQKAGFKLIVHDLHRQAASHHVNAGAIWADSPRALASQADVIFSSLPEPPDVEAVALGPDGLVAGMKPGAAYFDLSTNSLTCVKRLHAEQRRWHLEAKRLGGLEVDHQLVFGT